MGHGDDDKSCVGYLWENGEAQEKGKTLSNARPDASMMSGDDREG